jgi:predicted AAA+ superfamily ATPase
VQRVPSLLDIVHQSIEKTNRKFALAGSSARKLKRGDANLLSGRVYTYHLFPCTFEELISDFNLHDALEWGTLPKITTISSREEHKVFL